MIEWFGDPSQTTKGRQGDRGPCVCVFWSEQCGETQSYRYNRGPPSSHQSQAQMSSHHFSKSSWER